MLASERYFVRAMCVHVRVSSYLCISFFTTPDYSFSSGRTLTLSCPKPSPHGQIRLCNVSGQTAAHCRRAVTWATHACTRKTDACVHPPPPPPPPHAKKANAEGKGPAKCSCLHTFSVYESVFNCLISLKFCLMCLLLSVYNASW